MASPQEQHLILRGCSVHLAPSLTPHTTTFQPAHTMVIGEAELFLTHLITICLQALTMEQWEVTTCREHQEVLTM